MIQVSPELTEVINKAIQEAGFEVVKIEVVSNLATAYVRSKASQNPQIEEVERAVQDFIQGDIGVESAINAIKALPENTITLTEESVIADQ